MRLNLILVLLIVNLILVHPTQGTEYSTIDRTTTVDFSGIPDSITLFQGKVNTENSLTILNITVQEVVSSQRLYLLLSILFVKDSESRPQCNQVWTAYINEGDEFNISFEWVYNPQCIAVDAPSDAPPHTLSLLVDSHGDDPEAYVGLEVHIALSGEEKTAESSDSVGTAESSDSVGFELFMVLVGLTFIRFIRRRPHLPRSQFTS